MTQAERSQAIDQAIWTTALRLGEFSYGLLAAEAHASMGRVQVLVKQWRGAKAVAFVGPGPLGRHLFRVTGPAAPLPQDGRTKEGVRSPEQNMWATMHRQGAFTPTDLVALCNTSTIMVSPDEASAYCQMLLRAGYLRVLTKAVPGKIEAKYRLIRYTGPLPPVSRRTTVVMDQNLGKIVYVAGGAEA